MAAEDWRGSLGDPGQIDERRLGGGRARVESLCRHDAQTNGWPGPWERGKSVRCRSQRLELGSPTFEARAPSMATKGARKGVAQESGGMARSLWCKLSFEAHDVWRFFLGGGGSEWQLADARTLGNGIIRLRPAAELQE